MNCEARRIPKTVQHRTRVPHVLADRSRCKPSHLDEMFSITSEQIALPALRKGRFSSALSEHLKKEMQRGAIKPSIAAHS